MHRTERDRVRADLIEECAWSKQWLESIIDIARVTAERIRRRQARLFPAPDQSDPSAAKADAEASAIAFHLIDDLNAIASDVKRICGPG